MPTMPRRPAAQRERDRLQARRLRAAERFTGELWTLARIALVIWRLTGVRHHPAHVWALLRHRLDWTMQRPRRRAGERDQDAIDRWVKANLTSPTLAEVIAQANQGIERVRQTRHLAYSFLRHTGLSVA